jgi:hypothetical protein
LREEANVSSIVDNAQQPKQIQSNQEKNYSHVGE